MHAADIWNQFALYRHKVVLLTLLCALSLTAQGQIFKWASMHNPHYDDKKLTYGFMIGLHTSTYQIKYSDLFVTPKQDTLHSVIPSFSPGGSLGFLVNYRLDEFLDLRVMPKVGFYIHRLTYYYTSGATVNQYVETAVAEFPLLLKYKSSRRGNVRMYMIGGFTPGIEVSGKNDVQSNTANLAIHKANLTMDGGLGFDFYFPLFKFSQEIRFSRGLVNMLGSDPNQFHAPLQRINTNTISVYFIFQ